MTPDHLGKGEASVLVKTSRETKGRVVERRGQTKAPQITDETGCDAADDVADLYWQLLHQMPPTRPRTTAPRRASSVRKPWLRQKEVPDATHHYGLTVWGQPRRVSSRSIGSVSLVPVRRTDLAGLDDALRTRVVRVVVERLLLGLLTHVGARPFLTIPDERYQNKVRTQVETLTGNQNLPWQTTASVLAVYSRPREERLSSFSSTPVLEKSTLWLNWTIRKVLAPVRAENLKFSAPDNNPRESKLEFQHVRPLC